MTSATIPGLDAAPTNHAGLLAWVREVAELTQPDRVMFADELAAHLALEDEVLFPRALELERALG